MALKLSNEPSGKDDRCRLFLSCSRQEASVLEASIVWRATFCLFLRSFCRRLRIASYDSEPKKFVAFIAILYLVLLPPSRLGRFSDSLVMSA